MLHGGTNYTSLAEGQGIKASTAILMRPLSPVVTAEVTRVGRLQIELNGCITRFSWMTCCLVMLYINWDQARFPVGNKVLARRKKRPEQKTGRLPMQQKLFPQLSTITRD
jgi:hypothetical protein